LLLSLLLLLLLLVMLPKLFFDLETLIAGGSFARAPPVMVVVTVPADEYMLKLLSLLGGRIPFRLPTVDRASPSDRGRLRSELIRRGTTGLPSESRTP
jgi:hypothetical protein